MKNRKNLKQNACRLTACALAVTTSLTMIPVNVLAKEPGTSKEEVVYINLNTDGSVDEINVVNIFDLEKAGTITDYGKYEEVRNMTTEDAINYKNDTVTITTDKADEIYYEGKLTDDTIPWNIELHYYLDGKEYDAEDLAGKSGSLKITMSVKENTDCKGDYFDSCALQASFTLDTEKCKNIVAEGATIANVGVDKQLTYTVLPGSGTDVTITADVTDFEMPAAAINGISLSMDIDMDTDELTDKVTELMDAISQLNDGAAQLNDGANELADGASELKNGTAQLNTGITSMSLGVAKIKQALSEVDAQSDTLTNGSAQVYEGLKQLRDGLNEAAPTEAEIKALTTASQQTMDGINQLMNGLKELEANVSYKAYNNILASQTGGQDCEDLKAANSQAANSISSIISSLEKPVAEIDNVIAKLETYKTTPVVGDLVSPLIKQLESLKSSLSSNSAIAQLKNLGTLLNANNANIKATENYLDTVNANIDEMIAGVSELQSGYSQFNAEIQNLAGTLGSLPLSEVDLLVSSYAELDAGINAYTDGVGQILDGTAEASSGANALLKGSNALTDGTNKLADGANTLADGTGELADGTSTLHEATDGMDSQISERIDELMSSISGDDYEPASFTDADNTAEAVQFVIQTKPIAIEETEEVVEEVEEELSLWDKILNLFK